VREERKTTHVSTGSVDNLFPIKNMMAFSADAPSLDSESLILD
jgi:hypothetical protein